jgi:hypothetical protein
VSCRRAQFPGERVDRVARVVGEEEQVGAADVAVEVVRLAAFRCPATEADEQFSKFPIASTALVDAECSFAAEQPPPVLLGVGEGS